MNIHLPNGTRHYTAGTYSFYEEHKEHSGQQLWLHLIRYGAVMCEGVVYWGKHMLFKAINKADVSLYLLRGRV